MAVAVGGCHRRDFASRHRCRRALHIAHFVIADEFGLSHALALLTGLTTVVILVFGEITPKTFAKRHAGGYSVFIMPVVATVYWALFPLVWLFVQIPRALARATGSAENGDLPRAIDLGHELANLDFGYKSIGTLLDKWESSGQRA